MKLRYGLYLMLLLSFTRSGGQKAEEYAAKAAFMYNFTKFIEWPSKGAKPFNILLLRECAILKPLHEIASNKKVDEQKIEVSTLKGEFPAAPEMLFVPAQVSKERADIAIRYYQGKNTLIVTEKKGYLDKGAGINFLIQDHKIRFEVNLKSFEQAGLTASSQLLKLAVKVKQ